VILNPHNAFQLITVSLDGHIKFWNYLDGVLIRTLDIAHPIYLVAAHEQFRETLFVATGKRKKKADVKKGGVYAQTTCPLLTY
jgi:NET1-associated nuclear protein 1 (U3 small nucleolar RNA-associated protein 17)